MPSYEKEITNHLEFLGYEVEDLKAENGHIFIAKHPKKSNIVVRIFNNTCILTTRWGGFRLDALKSRDFFETMNNINQSDIGKWYYEVEEEEQTVTIVTEMDYYDYNKTTFGTLIDGLDSEVQRNLEKFSKFYDE